MHLVGGPPQLLRPMAALLISTPPPRAACPIALFGNQLPDEVVKMHAGFYEPSERERSKGAPAKPPLSAVTPLWAALKNAYGSDELALKAARQNPTVINPLYSKPATIATSKSGLVKAMGSEEEALAIMLQNPAILQCGEGLELQSPDEIKRFAQARALFDAVPPQLSLAALSVVLLVGLCTIALRGSEEQAVQQALSVVRPIIAAPAIALFLATAGNAGKAQADLKKAEAAAKEKAARGS